MCTRATSPSLVALTLAAFTALAGCAADAATDVASEGDALTSAAHPDSQSSEFHGTVSVDMMDALDPDSRLHTPFAWDLGRQVVLVLPAQLGPDHPVHSWDVVVTEDETKLELTAEAIKTYANGKPDMRGSNVRSTYGVRDIDTVMTLFKKENGGYTFVGKNDDGISDSKASWLLRNVVKGGVYHVIVEAKNHDTRGVVGLYVGATPQHPSDP